jgi:hypothetical protein
VAAAALCLAAACFAGCGPSGSGPKTVKAKVKVMFDDGTPLPLDTMLQFKPEAGDAKYLVSASIPTDGEFTLATSFDQTGVEGAPPGKYKVTVQVGAGAVELAGPKPKPECTDPSKTPLSIEITEAGAVTPNPLKVPKQ